MPVLGIETSCDETAVAVYDGHRGLLSHCLHSQVSVHAPFGGVVPELASRDHIRRLLPLIEAALRQAGIAASELTGIAYTAGPGLVGALLVGATTAVGLAVALKRPVIGVHHMEAHLLAPFLEPRTPEFPFIALLVSGGHTLLVEVRALGAYRVLGETIDDAVGEAFDKGAKLLGLPYPGGPHLARLAELGRPGRFVFPRPMHGDPGLDFSFSGLKTALMTRLRDAEKAGPVTESVRADLANSYQTALVDALLVRALRAVERTGVPRLIVAGGVGANRQLRERLQDELTRRGAAVFYPRAEFCTDNAAMVALTGFRRLAAGECSGLLVEARPRWPLADLRPPGIAADGRTRGAAGLSGSAAHGT